MSLFPLWGHPVAARRWWQLPWPCPDDATLRLRCCCNAAALPSWTPPPHCHRHHHHRVIVAAVLLLPPCCRDTRHSRPAAALPPPPLRCHQSYCAAALAHSQCVLAQDRIVSSIERISGKSLFFGCQAGVSSRKYRLRISTKYCLKPPEKSVGNIWLIFGRAIFGQSRQWK